ncbi:DUF4145 domain-containing protein [Paenibacillus helianthi]|uniref:DUF4145 domain-containing protein n=1 Tax=Paenibacillus helianthi TaxID=1349432 RepID=UPI0009F93BF3|nr:DUF4145 domain-containing protein [Paenibacillus helianthi]
MSRSIKYARPGDGKYSAEYFTNVNRYPDKCPICNVVLEPRIIYASYSINGNSEIVFFCTKRECQSLFISYYFSGDITEWQYLRSAPHNLVTPEFSEEINEISPLFKVIYGQAYIAENSALNHIAGMGYRKALEFLIKDYLINFLEKERVSIEKKLLGKCIKDDVDNSNIKQVAERAVWIGNDETHYVRKWETKDVSDLKKLIDVTVHWISSEIITKRVIEEMQ